MSCSATLASNATKQGQGRSAVVLRCCNENLPMRRRPPDLLTAAPGLPTLPPLPPPAPAGEREADRDVGSPPPPAMTLAALPPKTPSPLPGGARGAVVEDINGEAGGNAANTSSMLTPRGLAAMPSSAAARSFILTGFSGSHGGKERSCASVAGLDSTRSLAVT